MNMEYLILEYINLRLQSSNLSTDELKRLEAIAGQIIHEWAQAKLFFG